MKHRLLLLILVLLSGATASAQTIAYGLAARGGAFKTFASKEIKNRGIDYSIGPQVGIGAWVKLPFKTSEVQVTLLQTADQQKAGEVQYYDSDSRTIQATDLIYRTLGVQLTAVYLYPVTAKLALGAGAGIRHTFKARGTIESSSDSRAPESNYSITRYRNNVSVLLPLEAHYKLSNHFTLLAQTQLQLTNRLRDAQPGYWERDLGLSLGVNYAL